MPKYFPPETSVEEFEAALRETYGGSEEESREVWGTKEARRVMREQGHSEALIKLALGDEGDE
ncbi:MAG: hypothetical protein BRC23_01885 [Parcubacteria group bacterium SW_4_49_11]|nr:MAG: hypothetical protein BRC23_01885 [Parcubacteria group bacterium SW_4_49_11]